MEKQPGYCFECANSRKGLCRFSPFAGAFLPTTLICIDPPDKPGQVKEVLYGGTCRNFRPKPQPPLRGEPPEPTTPGTAWIPLTKGLHVLVDAADAEWLRKYKWHALVVKGRVYAVRSVLGGTILMHREIMQPPPGMDVDHKNHNGLDDRRDNLRVCTRQENSFNSRPRGKGCGYKGVYRRGDKWGARIRHRGETLRLGLYDDPVEAAKVRDRKALELQGPFAYLNFPDEIRAEQGKKDAEPPPDGTESK